MALYAADCAMPTGMCEAASTGKQWELQEQLPNVAVRPVRLMLVNVAGGNGVGGRESGWHKVAQLGQAGSAKPFEVDFRHELVKRVRRKIEAESFQEVRLPGSSSMVARALCHVAALVVECDESCSVG